MEINKNNYEEYFLLYADNELSGPEKNAVEAFVKQHADLEEEFLLIRQSVIKPDPGLKLESKGFLFKEADKFINKYNYQEIFLLYNDDELSGPERKETEAFIIQNPSFKNEFGLLEKTKLEPDANIIFPAKKSLYKREGEERIIPFGWWKPAAAAILLGAGIFVGIELLHSKDKELPAVKNATVKKMNKARPVPAAIKPVEATRVEESSTPKNAAGQTVFEKPARKEPVMKKPEAKNPEKLKNDKQPEALPSPEEVARVNGNDNEKAGIVKEIQPAEDISVVNKNDEKDNSVYKEDHSVYHLSGKDDIAGGDKAGEHDALTASYADDENANRNNYAFYNITEEKFNKSKVGGFLRKVKRIIERKSPFYKIKDKSEIAVK